MFPDTDRDMDIEFDGNGVVDSLHPFQVNVSASSLGIWVSYVDNGGTGTFLSLHLVK